MQNNTQSAGHQFDILVMATGKTTLSEDALAVRHDGDEYFADSKLEAWELKYTPENVQWSNVRCTIILEANDGYKLTSTGTVMIGDTEYILWKCGDSIVEDYDTEYAVSADAEVGTDLFAYDPETGEIPSDSWTSTIDSSVTVDKDGAGTILWMKDEFGNECPYDFKNIQFKRWKATDAQSGREGLNDRYMIGDSTNYSYKLRVDDEEDYIWAYTFSSSGNGGLQEDYSLGGYDVHDNVIKPYGKLLPNNVMFGSHVLGNIFGLNCIGNTLGEESFSNSFGDGCINNSLGLMCTCNSFGDECKNNSFGSACYDNTIGSYFEANSWGKACSFNSCGCYCNYNILGNTCKYISLANNCSNITLGSSCSNVSFGNGCSSISIANNFIYSTLFDGVMYAQVTTQNVKNVQVLNGVAGTSSSKLTLGFEANKAYTQVACKNSSGQLVIYVPGDVVREYNPQDVLFAYLNERLTDLGSNQTVKELVCIYEEGDSTQASVLGFFTNGELYYPMFNSTDQGFAFVISGTIDATTDQFVITAVNGSDEIDSNVYNTIESSVDGVFSYDDAQSSQLDYLTSYLVGKKLNIFYC